MHYTIYKIVNNINGKVYIGKHQTKDLNDDYMGSGKHLKHAFQKYGVEHFSKEILFNFELEESMNAKEKELVTEEFCLREDTYNICVGGQGGFSYIRNNLPNGMLGKQQTNKQKIAASKSGIKNRINLKRGGINPQAFKGRSHSNDTKHKMSRAKSGKSLGAHNSQFGSMWITNGAENKKIKNADIIPEGWYKGRKIIARSSSG